MADGDWELYTNSNYQGEGFIVKSGVVYGNLKEYNDQFSSAKPSGSSASRGPLIEVWSEGNYGSGDYKEYTKDEWFLHEWNDKIRSVCATVCAWELYGDSNYKGNKVRIEQGTCTSLHTVNYNFMSQASSLKPFC